MTILDSVAKAYRWSPNEIFSLTDTQLSLVSHAAWVSYERGEAKRKKDNTCEQCGEEGMYDGKCKNERCKYERPKKSKSSKIDNRNVIEWPPNSGKLYKDDSESTALDKLKAADVRGYMKYVFGT